MQTKKHNRKKRYKKEIWFDNWDKDAISSNTVHLKNFYFLSRRNDPQPTDKI